MLPRIAVLAVHGVADQAPHDSARDMAELLCRLGFDGSSRRCYDPFRLQGVAIPVRPLVPDAGHVTSDLVRDPGSSPLDEAFTREALKDFAIRGDEAVYETVVLESVRSDEDGSPVAAVDIYEMYWADLSRLSTGWLRIFGELYQLLLHVGSLAVHVATGVVARRNGRTARAFRLFVRMAATLLGVPIAVLNLALGVAALLVLADRLTPYAQPCAVALSAGVTMVAAGALFSRIRRFPALVSFGVLGAIAAAAIADWTALATRPPAAAVAQFGTVVVVAGSAALAALLRKYTSTRPGSATFSAVTVPIVLVGGTASVWLSASRPHALVYAGFHLAEPLYLALRAPWIALVLASWGALAAGALLLIQRRHDCPVRRAVWSALLCLSMPSMAFLFLTCALWKALAMAAGPLGASMYALLPVPFIGLRTRTTTLDGFADLLLRNSVGDGLPLMLLLMAGAVVIAAWAIGPVVWAEIFPPSHNRQSAALGNWLTNGFRLMAFAGGLIVVAFFFVLPIGAGVTDATGHGTLAAIDGLFQLLGAGLNLKLLFGVVGLPATSLLVFANRLQSLAAGFRTPLDILLDVDNYLRMDPRTHTVRARIFARYVSVLSRLSRRDALHPDGYDGIVIVAHSQGTVITADLLRFLRATGAQAGLRLPPIHLFTMGSPLRQLYGERFPDLYAWAFHEDHSAWSAGARIPATQLPDPRELGVERWLNAYRSGDYVGRWLWRADQCADQFASGERTPWIANVPLPLASDAEGRRLETCIGAGAHTHYWDQTAPDVAVLLDRLVAEAAPAVV